MSAGTEPGGVSGPASINNTEADASESRLARTQPARPGPDDYVVVTFDHSPLSIDQLPEAQPDNGDECCGSSMHTLSVARFV